MWHRVGRVLSFFSSRRNWDSPNLSPAGECAPPLPWFWGEGHTRWRKRGWNLGESQFRLGDIHCGTLYIYVRTFWAEVIPLLATPRDPPSPHIDNTYVDPNPRVQKDLALDRFLLYTGPKLKSKLPDALQRTKDKGQY